MENTLYYGDNLEILRQYVPDESIDLVYLDPPFNSNATYNVLFREASGEGSSAQFQAFDDTWHWDIESERAYRDVVQNGPKKLADLLQAMRSFLGQNDMMAYLTMMAQRMVELHRVLKPTGSIYLHCDPTASHYLKLLMDATFGARNFRNEITWQRTESHNTAEKYGNIADILLYYCKSEETIWNRSYHKYSDGDQKYSEQQMKRFSHIDDQGRRYRLDDLTGPRPNSDSGKFNWRGTMPSPSRGWGYKLDQLEEWWAEGRIHTKKDGTPRMDGLKVFLDESEGKALQNVWTDIPRVSNTSSERLGYPTQKPEALIERIIASSSNEGDVVLDPFCGCGTAVAAAEKLKRQWIGIDLTHLAVALMKNRLKTAFNLLPVRDYAVVGEPVDVGSARALAQQDRFQFQFWALSLLEAFPREQGKRGADRGIDGVLYFIDGAKRAAKKVIVQVKSGRVTSSHVRDLRGAMEREKAAMGLFITLEEPTREMRTEAFNAGSYRSEVWQRSYPRLQIRTVGELLAGEGFHMPSHPSMYYSAQRTRPSMGEQGMLMEAPAVYVTGE